MSDTFKKDLESLADSLKTIEVGRDFWVLGGQIAAAQEQAVHGFLDAWSASDTRMVWAVVDTLREMRLGRWDVLRALALSSFATLARVRIFGEGGDVTLRRDDDTWRWHFVGNQTALPVSVGGTSLLDGSRYFLETDKNALLWGKMQNGARREDRVAAANLDYSGAPMSEDQRLTVVYDEYAADGAVQFVWFRNIVEAKAQVGGTSRQVMQGGQRG